MLILLAFLGLVLAWPHVVRALRALVRLHLYAVVLCLPAGLLLVSGRIDSTVEYAVVTLAWAPVVALYALRRARPPSVADRTRRRVPRHRERPDPRP